MVYMLQAAFWFAVMALLVKLAGNCGLPTMQIVFARALVTLTLSAIALKQAGLRAIGNNTRLLLLRLRLMQLSGHGEAAALAGDLINENRLVPPSLATKMELRASRVTANPQRIEPEGRRNRVAARARGLGHPRTTRAASRVERPTSPWTQTALSPFWLS